MTERTITMPSGNTFVIEDGIRGDGAECYSVSRLMPDNSLNDSGGHAFIDYSEAVSAAVNWDNQIEGSKMSDKPIIDDVYAERNKLVALLCQIFPCWKRAEDDEWEIVYIILPYAPRGEGEQISFHVHKNEMLNFADVPRCNDLEWDGHDNDEKWHRVLKCILRLAEARADIGKPFYVDHDTGEFREK